MTEKEAIEKATAEAFITIYNSELGESFSIVEYSDAPDIRCRDANGNSLNLEITMTEDCPRDIQAALGRSDHRSLERLRERLGDMEDDEKNPFGSASLLQGNVTGMIVGRIQSKLCKDYGFDTALVIKDSSPLDWDWNLVADQIVSLLDLKRNPFDKGIWIISDSKDKIFRLL